MKEFDNNMSKVLDIQLALENYQDNTGENTDLINKAFSEISILRKSENELSEEERLNSSKNLLIKLNKLLDEIGREKFIFYDDGDIDYIWKHINSKTRDTNNKDDKALEYARYNEDENIKIENLNQEVEIMFSHLVAAITKILSFKSYKEAHKEYKKVLSIILKWSNKYNISKKLSLINHKDLLDVYKKLEELKSKWLFDANLGEESELSDEVIVWMWELMQLRKLEIEKEK
jgi:hypothetical protein